MTGHVRIADLEPKWSADFARLNIEWLERWFTVEPHDLDVLGDPFAHIIAPGGCVLLAIEQGEAGESVLGTVALMRDRPGVYELTKMAVVTEARGRGIGRQLLSAAIARFRSLGGRELFLESNRKLVPAITLYESGGFEHRPAPRPGSPYARADVYMVWRDQSAGGRFGEDRGESIPIPGDPEVPA